YMRMKYVFIGSSAACISAVYTVTRRNPAAKLQMFSAQKEQPNNTCVIKNVLAGRCKKEDIFLLLPTQLSLHLEHEVVRISAAGRYIVTANDSRFFYDRLIVGTGTRAYVPDIFKPYVKNGVFSYHNLDDVTDILRYIAEYNIKTVAVVG